MKHLRNYETFKINESVDLLGPIVAVGLIYGYDLVKGIVNKQKFLSAMEEVEDISSKIEKNPELEDMFDRLADMLEKAKDSEEPKSEEFISLSNEVDDKLKDYLTPEEYTRWSEFTKKYPKYF